MEFAFEFLNFESFSNEMNWQRAAFSHGRWLSGALLPNTRCFLFFYIYIWQIIELTYIFLTVFTIDIL